MNAILSKKRELNILNIAFSTINLAGQIPFLAHRHKKSFIYAIFPRNTRTLILRNCYRNRIMYRK